MEKLLLIAACVIGIVLIAISILKKKRDLFVNYMLRISAGLLFIYVANLILERMAIDISVGINGYSILILGVLGAPGFFMLYGISTYFALK